MRNKQTEPTKSLATLLGYPKAYAGTSRGEVFYSKKESIQRKIEQGEIFQPKYLTLLCLR